VCATGPKMCSKPGRRQGETCGDDYTVVCVCVIAGSLNPECKHKQIYVCIALEILSA
jgi:hypothetical protein